MKLCLGTMACNEAFMLRHTLPNLRPYFDGAICAYQHSEDGTHDLLKAHDFTILLYEWKRDWADCRNRVIHAAEELGYDWMLMLDADESMLTLDLQKFRDYMNNGEKGYAFPRYEFVDDFNHYCPVFYPDLQCRAFPLKKGFLYHGKMHEQLRVFGDRNALDAGRISKIPLHIFHYGKSKPIVEVALKYLNYDRAYKWLEPLPTLPTDYPLPATMASGEKKLFEGPKPI